MRLRISLCLLVSFAAVTACSEADTPASKPLANAPVETVAVSPPRPLQPPSEPPPPGSFDHRGELVREAVVVDLASVVEFAWLDREFGTLKIGAAEQRRFTNGWFPARDEKANRPAFIEATGRSSAIEIPIAQVADRQLELDVEPIDAPDKLPDQVVRVVWNDTDLGRYVLDFSTQTLRIPVPARAQTIGSNRLRLEPLYWISAAGAGKSRDNRPISFKLRGLRLEGGSDDESRPASGVRAESGRIHQPSGAIIAWHRVVPVEAALAARLTWQGSAPGADGRLRVDLVTETGEETRLVDRALREISGGEGMALDVDLGAYAGRVIAIQASVSPGAGEGEIVWEGARITGARHTRAVEAKAVRDRYDVLVILFDTLRADQLEPYGNTVVQTPHLAALAASGFTFANAGSNASWTKPSVASLWTGLHPAAHRVVMTPSSVPTSAPYLPSELNGAGWRTIGVSTNAHFSKNFGFDRGFDVLHEYYLERKNVVKATPSPEGQAAHIWGSYLAPAFDTASDQPVFAVVHEIDPHSPYEAPEPYASLYDFGYVGNIDGWDVDDLDQGYKVVDAINNPSGWLGEADRRAMRAQYMAEVSFVDAYVGALMQHLDASGRRDRTLVIFVSDHGEQFFEHGAWGHGRSLYQEELAVPLIFSLPGVIPAGLRSDLPVELVDVAPTILDLVGVGPQPAMQGRSLLPDMLAGPEASASLAPQFAMSNIVILGKGSVLPSSQVWDSVRLGRWKLHRSNHRRFGVPQYEFELYDLERDPEEVLDLWSSQPVVGQALKELLDEKLARDEALSFEAGSVEDIDSDVLDNLRGLGYVE